MSALLEIKINRIPSPVHTRARSFPSAGSIATEDHDEAQRARMCYQHAPNSTTEHSMSGDLLAGFISGILFTVAALGCRNSTPMPPTKPIAKPTDQQAKPSNR